MEYAGKDYIINTVFRTNILPIISECNTACIFCSNKFNPDGIEVYRLGKISIEEFAEIIKFLSPNKKIVVGEAATRIIEGEPLLYDNFIELLELIRSRYKHTCIQITTNGILLNESLINRMVELGNIELNISINSINSIKRKQILGIKNEDEIKGKIVKIRGRLKFSASCVYVPEILSLEDIEEIISFLESNNAESVRVFLPGYTKIKGSTIDFFQIHDEVNNFIKSLRLKYHIPIMVEPTYITELECCIDGVVKDSPADKAGIKYGDIILGVNKEVVRTRVEAYNKAYRLNNPILTVRRGKDDLFLKVMKPKNISAGFVVSYDIDPEIIDKIIATVKNHVATKILLMTSELSFAIINQIMGMGDFDFSFEILKVKNNFFGGTIKCAGLLTIQDINTALTEYLNETNSPDLILLPPIMFDYKKKDLLGYSIKEVEENFKIPVDTI